MRLNKVGYMVMVMRSVIFVLVLSFVIMAQSSGDPNNSLTGSLAVHDPATVIKSNGMYYTWGSNFGGNLTSKDRVQWSSNGKSPPQSQSWWSAHGGSMWAPDVCCMNGVYYCYYSVSASNNFQSALGVTTSPTLDPATAVWTDKGIVVDNSMTTVGDSAVNNIDPSEFLDSDGTWYLVWGSFKSGMRIMAVNPLTGLAKDKPAKIIKINPRSGEAPAICHWKNYYYFAMSRGTCCAGMKSTYYMCYGRATSVGGPYVTKNGSRLLDNAAENLLSGTKDPNTKTGVVGVGVGGFFWDGANGLDTLFINYMAYTAPSGSALLNIKPMYADAQGWLTLDPKMGTVMTQPSGPVSIGNRGKLPIVNYVKKQVSIRLIADGNYSRQKSYGAMYSISGQRVYTKVNGRFSNGIYIEKNFVK